MSRELTAWAGSWSLTRLATPGIGPILWQVASGLGPPRPAQHRGSLAKAAIQTVDDALASSLAQQGGLAVSRLDGRGFSLRTQRLWHFCQKPSRSFRGPFLGSAPSPPCITAGSMPLGRMRRLKENSLLAWPLSPLAATLTRPAWGFWAR